MSILRDFCKGRIQPHDYFGRREPESSVLEDKIEDVKYNWLRKKLSEEDFQKFEDELQRLYFDIGTYWEERGFKYGFKLGAMIMIDVLTGNEDLLEDT